MNLNQTPQYQLPNLDVSWQQLQDLVKDAYAKLNYQAKEFQAQQAHSECKCHVVDTNKTPILMWADKNSPQFKTKCPGCSCHSQNFILKQADQKFISLIRVDKHKNIYWKYRNLIENESKEPQAPPAPIKCFECKAEMEIIGERDKSIPLRCFDCEKNLAQAQPQNRPDLKEIKENETTNSN